MQRGVEQLKKLNSSHPYLFRLDGGNDSFDTLKVLIDSGHFFLIKRNKRKESNHYWLDMAQSIGRASIPREGKIVYTGVFTKSHPKATEDTPDLDIVFKVTERTITHDGNHLLIPEIEVETYWTNLYEDPETVIALYHDHGTSEQFHSELKTDMNVERFPSKDFTVNNLFLQIAMIAFNALRFIGQSTLRYGELLPVKTGVKRKRLRKVISDLICVACKLIYHSREYVIRIWEGNPWAKVFLELHRQFQIV
ncbi:MAG: transposase [bacterium]|nr:transposase [bacterium]